MSLLTVCSNIAGYFGMFLWDEPPEDANTKIIRWVAGGLAIVVLVIIIQRRRTRVK